MQRRETPGGNQQIAFNPYEMTSIIPQLQEQNARDKVTNQRYQDQLNENAEVKIREAEQQERAAVRWGKEVQSLAKFSKTLTNYFVEEEKKKNQAEMEAGIADAYTNGISVEEEVELDQAEEELAADSDASQGAAADA